MRRFSLFLVSFLLLSVDLSPFLNLFHIEAQATWYTLDNILSFFLILAQLRTLSLSRRFVLPCPYFRIFARRCIVRLVRQYAQVFHLHHPC